MSDMFCLHVPAIPWLLRGLPWSFLQARASVVPAALGMPMHKQMAARW